MENQYDRIGAAYIAGQESYHSKREDWAIKCIAKNLVGKRILDIGCGHGVDVLKYEKSMDAYGIDCSPFMIGEAKKRVAHPDRVQVADMRKIPFETAFFDIVVSRFAIHYLNTLDDFFAEVARVLKPQGRFTFVVPYPVTDIGTVKTKLYDGAVAIEYPSHKLSEYFSNTFLEHFCIDQFDEYYQEDPTAMAISAVKR